MGERSARLLTTREIDEIVAGFGGGSRSAAVDVEPRTWDVNRPVRVPPEKMQGLALRHEQAARALAEVMRRRFRCDTAVRLAEVDQIRFDSFRASLPEIVCGFQVRAAPLVQPAHLILDFDLAFRALDRLLGGPGESASDPRELTRTETAVIGEFVEMILGVADEAWKGIHALKFEPGPAVSVPRFIESPPGSEVMLAVRFEVTGALSGSIILALPLSELEAPIRAARETRREAPRDRKTAAVTPMLRGVGIDVAIRLGGAEISMAELAALEPSDILVLDRSIGESVEMLVEGVPKYRGRLGRRGNAFAFKVGTAIAPDEGRIRRPGAA